MKVLNVAWNRVLCGGVGVLCLLGNGCQPTEPTEAQESRLFMVGISPELERTHREEVFRDLVRFVLEDLPGGSSLRVYDAHNLVTIAEVEIPTLRAFQSERTRANQFKQPLDRIRRFMSHSNDASSSEEDKANRQRIDFPAFLELVSQGMEGSSTSTEVLVVGNPLYSSEQQPHFSMVEGYFPTDGHLLANRSRSVFGMGTVTNGLKGINLHFGYFGSPWGSDLQKDRVERFWTRYVALRGGCVSTFSGDRSTWMRRFTQGNRCYNSSETWDWDETKDRVEMIRILREVDKNDWITRDAKSLVAVEPPQNLIGPVKIGIRWQGDWDLDLYARSRPDRPRLYFEQETLPEGYFFKDHRSSPEREYEFVEFEQAIHLKEVEAWVNFYEGRAEGGARGEVRLEFEGRIYSGSFSIAAEEGNMGREGAEQESYWVELPLKEVLGILALPSSSDPSVAKPAESYSLSGTGSK